ncbi:MAG: hypothetical protein H6668_06740 [Ardenticatenaceae bacterium]|nr:hypothetical protein [Ardenticatenaceae bacterium]
MLATCQRPKDLPTIDVYTVLFISLGILVNLLALNLFFSQLSSGIASRLTQTADKSFLRGIP